MTDRMPLDNLTSDQLDALYRRLAVAEDERALDNVAMRAIARQRDEAEATLDRGRALAATWRRTTVPIGTSINRWWDARLVELNTALEPPAAP